MPQFNTTGMLAQMQAQAQAKQRREAGLPSPGAGAPNPLGAGVDPMATPIQYQQGDPYGSAIMAVTNNSMDESPGYESGARTALDMQSRLSDYPPQLKRQIGKGLVKFLRDFS